MIHKLKIYSQFVRPILSGEKTFEIRQNDHCFQKGDRVNFGVNNDQWVHENKSAVLELERKIFVITYVISGWGLKNGFVAFGFREEE